MGSITAGRSEFSGRDLLWFARLGMRLACVGCCFQ
jgi:hypothetical protein